uniref:Transposase n=1 Tax=Candidatus Kentrum sp. LFY TaxID=2126342 RepID=A0A450U8Y9_9GAMM|nr:MAG: Transposase [Candidatus Kentron sp. LFY]
MHPLIGAKLFLDSWCAKTIRSKIEPMKKVARMLQNHRYLLLNWFCAERRFSGGIVEGFNNKAKLTTRKAYGFRRFANAMNKHADNNRVC